MREGVNSTADMEESLHREEVTRCPLDTQIGWRWRLFRAEAPAGAKAWGFEEAQPFWMRANASAEHAAGEAGRGTSWKACYGEMRGLYFIL